MAEEGYIGALCRIDQVLRKVKDCSAELNEIERIVAELKTDAHSSFDDIEERPDLLLVAGTLRDMLNVLETGLKGIPDKQKMQVAIQGITSIPEVRASGKDNTRSKRIRLSTQAEPSNVCSNSSTETRVAKRAAWNGPEICTTEKLFGIITSGLNGV